MKPERWELVAELYRSALDREEAERGAFLATACGRDEELRQEVESLLDQDGKAESFMERPALEVAAKGLAAVDECPSNPTAALALQGNRLPESRADRYSFCPAEGAFTAPRLFHPWKCDKSPAFHASRSPGVLRSQSGRISLVTARRSCQRSTTDGRPQNQ
jgi:hypothetical protein